MLFKNGTAGAADTACLRSLHDLRTWTRSIKTLDPVHKYIVAYAIILCSGTLERAFKNIIADQVSVGCSPQVCKCIDRVIRQCSTNPRYEEIVKVLSMFDKVWSAAFKMRVQELPEHYRQSLESLVKNRNLVAHGGAVTSGFGEVVSYYYRARRVVAQIEKAIVVEEP